MAVAVVVAAGLVTWRIAAGGSDGGPAEASIPAGWPEAGASRTVTEVRADGTLEVTHWIHTEEPLDEIDVALPQGTEDGTLEATDVRVRADGRSASGPQTLSFSRASYVFSGATRIQVRYRLAGAVEESTSAAGRGLATPTALDVSAVQPSDTRIVRSADVLSMACASSPDVSLAPCGEADGDGQWKVVLTGQEAGGRVVAAVTVPS
ncbi:hypothetical protein GCM10009797_12590 [Nocardioides hwasunensis]